MSQNHKVGEQGEAGSEPATFWEHLDVLRGEIIRMLAAAVLMAVVCFCLKDVLFEIVLAPSRSDFIVYRLLGTEPFDIHLINTGLTEQMMVHLKVAMVAGILVASPICSICCSGSSRLRSMRMSGATA